MADAPLVSPPSGAWPGRVLLAGGTGAVGQQLLARLATHAGVSELKVLLRRPFPLPARAQALHTSWQDLADHPDWFQVDTVFCALGTTIRQAGSQEAFRRVDHDHVLALACQAKAHGARQFLVVSALGADARSRVFYNRVKGELEDALRQLTLDGLVIARPSLLLDGRAHLGQPPRMAESLTIPLARWAAPLIPATYRPIHAAAVARALLHAVPTAQGVRVLSSGEMAAG